ncbi:hypothetical protein HKW97_24245 (plasmid) [Pseudomonas luteola]|uniref:dynamin family protein n=1 Tax=Pseudomonas luteola TaxID=47886 RepID=UPI003890DBDA
MLETRKDFRVCSLTPKGRAKQPLAEMAIPLDEPSPVIRSAMTTESTLTAAQPYQVLVLATMSAGKSTLINALLGHTLLPTSNLACTARAFRISHRPGTDWRVRQQTEGQTHAWHPATAQTLTALNRDASTASVCLEGAFYTWRQRGLGLVLLDTPGPNNSRSSAHGAVTWALLGGGEFHNVIYILNATQLGIDDDAQLLRQLRQACTDHRLGKPVFVLNKVDELDDEQGDSLAEVVDQAANYLRQAGFARPTVIPLSASLALAARKRTQGAPLSQKELGRLTATLRVPAQHLRRWLACARVPKDVRQRMREEFVKRGQRTTTQAYPLDSLSIDAQCLRTLELGSGIRTLEVMLEHLHSKQHYSARQINNDFDAVETP